MFFIVNDAKSFMKPECSVTQSSQSSAMSHPYIRAIADVLSGKNMFSTLWSQVIANSEGATGFCLI